MVRLITTAVVVAALCAVGAQAAADYVLPPANLDPAPYAPWAHSHWVWLSSGGDRSNQTSVVQFAKEFLMRNISVGAVDCDSGWSTGFNNFVVDTTKFPDMGAMVKELHAMDIKVILWATSMVDTNSPNYQYGLNHTYYVRNAFKENLPLHWWHGNGQLLDFTNPDAVAWWHAQMDNVLDLGIDGWKCDGTGPFIMEYIVPQASTGTITFREYEDLYYGDFFNYTREKRGEHALIMSRPVDSYPLLNASLSAYLQFSPKYVMYSGWVGDQDPTFPGLQDALRNIIHSAWHGYANFGSDIGGYRTGPGYLGRTKELFMRWFQMGAFVPLMENGGDKEHGPWKFDAPGSTFVVDVYRRFVDAHLELTPYLMTTGTRAMATGTSSISPVQPKPKNLWILQFNDITTYAYMLGDQIFVDPITEANITSQTVSLPAGATWYDYFNPSAIHAGGQNITVATPLQYFPVFAKTGAILPLNISNNEAGHGAGINGGGLTFLVHTPSLDAAGVTQTVTEYQSTGVEAGYAVTAAAGQPAVACGKPVDIVVNVTATPHAVTFLLLNVQASGADTDVRAATPEGTWDRALWAEVPTPASETSVGGLPQLVVQVPNPSAGGHVVVTDVVVGCV